VARRPIAAQGRRGARVRRRRGWVAGAACMNAWRTGRGSGWRFGMGGHGARTIGPKPASACGPSMVAARATRDAGATARTLDAKG
jgi:hypothetical protein